VIAVVHEIKSKLVFKAAVQFDLLNPDYLKVNKEESHASEANEVSSVRSLESGEGTDHEFEEVFFILNEDDKSSEKL